MAIDRQLLTLIDGDRGRAVDGDTNDRLSSVEDRSAYKVIRLDIFLNIKKQEK